mgnify:CR=1 FL=1
MKYIIITIVAVLGLGGLFFLTQNKDTTTTAPALTFQTVQADVASGGQLIDVRTPEEFASGHIDGAINLSLQEIEAGKLPTAAKDRAVYVYCRSGNRSAQAVTILKQAGYANVIDLGAMSAVQAIGGTVKT